MKYHLCACFFFFLVNALCCGEVVNHRRIGQESTLWTTVEKSSLNVVNIIGPHRNTCGTPIDASYFASIF